MNIIGKQMSKWKLYEIVGFESSPSFLIFKQQGAVETCEALHAQRAEPNLESAKSLNFPFEKDKTMLIYGNFEEFTPHGALFGLVMTPLPSSF